MKGIRYIAYLKLLAKNDATDMPLSNKTMRMYALAFTESDDVCNQSGRRYASLAWRNPATRNESSFEGLTLPSGLAAYKLVSLVFARAG